jgi:hypothetical protein
MGDNNGEVFTKPWVVDMMLDMCGYLSSDDLSKKRILEPSSGDGRFLVEIAQRLCSSAQLHGVSEDRLFDSISSFDINENNVARCRSNVSSVLKDFGWDEKEIKGTVENWIRHEDFLFQDLCNYDTVIGNPPYVRSSDIPAEKREKYTRACKTMTHGTDLFVGFIERGLTSMTSDGKLCFICADRWMQNSYGRKLREYIMNNHHMDAIVRMHGVDAFEKKVSAYPAIVLINGGNEDTVFADCGEAFSEDNVAQLLNCIKNRNNENPTEAFSLSKIKGFDCGKRPWPLADEKVLNFIKYSSSKFPAIEDNGIEIGIGIATGSDGTFITSVSDAVEADRMLPLLCSGDVVENKPPEGPVHWLINPWEQDGTLVDLKRYPLLNAHFESNRSFLSKRHVAKKSNSQWYRTIDKIKPGLAGAPKLLLTDMSSRSNPIYEPGNYYPHHNLYWLTSTEWDLEVLGGLLLSKQVESVVGAYGVKMRGKTMRFQAQYLRLIHLPRESDLEGTVRRSLKEAFRKRDAALATEAANDAFEISRGRMAY